MTFQQFVLILRARWRSAVSVLVGVIALVVALSLLLPAKYTGVASVVVDVKSPDPIAGLVMSGALVSSYMATQLDVLVSEPVVMQATKAVGIDKDPDLLEKWQSDTDSQGDYQSWLAAYITKKIDVKPSKASNVIVVNYTANSRELAARMANALVDAYIETTLSLRTQPARQFSKFFDDRAKQLRDTLERAQTRLSQFQRDNGILANDERWDVENVRLQEMSTQMVNLQALADDSTSRRAQAGSHAEHMQEVLRDPLIVSLTEEVASQEAKLNEMTARLGDAHPSVQQLRANVSQIRSRLDLATRRATASVTVSSDVNQARLAQMRAALAQQREKVLRMKVQRDQAAVLLRDVESAQRAYDAVLSRLSQSDIESQTTQTNVMALKRATPPSLASFPKMFLNIAIAIVVGSLLGIGFALLREMADPRLRRDEDIGALLGSLLLGVLPNRTHSTARLSASRSRLLSSGPRLLMPPT